MLTQSHCKSVKEDVPAGNSDEHALPDQTWQGLTDQSGELKDSLSSPGVALHGVLFEDYNVSFDNYKSQLLADLARRCVKIAGRKTRSWETFLLQNKRGLQGLKHW